ncbi:MAG: hypothetical protein HZB50_05870 [Chloroflexi bacterium]|nr:hypothetical protein [Chloroflexota bacterium]
MNIQNVNHLVHAYKVAPWRVQRQWIGTVLIVVIALAMISAIFLDVSSRTALAGREILALTASISTSQKNSGDLQTQLALLTSASVMEQRAQDLGFHAVETADMEYVIVPGYTAPSPKILSSSSVPQLSALSIPPEYNESLFEWLDKKLASSTRGQ